MTFTTADYMTMEARLRGKRVTQTASSHKPVEREVTLHEKIIKHCQSQWPVWKFRHARTDKRTTEEIGVEDFTIFLPGGKTLHVEVKARDEKQKKEQLIWAKQLEMLEHRVFVVRDWESFLELTKEQTP
jgi:hypothetical protein